MDALYWKQRCEAAEEALRKARTGIRNSHARTKILAALADLKQRESIDTHRACALLRVTENRACEVLRDMEALGLVQRTPGRPGRHGEPARWRLGYLVQVEAAE